MKPIKNNTYDCVIIIHVLSMVQKYQMAFDSIKRILKPGGYFFFNDGYSKTDNHSQSGSSKILRLFGKKQLRNELSKYFDTNVITGYDNINNNHTVFFICKK